MEKGIMVEADINTLEGVARRGRMQNPEMGRSFTHSRSQGRPSLRK